MCQRRACRVLGQYRSTQRHLPKGKEDEERLVEDMIELARQYGRYGYRRIAALLRDAGWQINDKRVERLWRREGLKVPYKQPKRGRLWFNDGSCIRLRAEHRNHVCDMRPIFPPAYWRIRRFVFDLMRPVFAMPFSWQIRWA